MVDFEAVRQSAGYKVFDEDSDRVVTLRELEEEHGPHRQHHGLENNLRSVGLPEAVALALREQLEDWRSAAPDPDVVLSLVFDSRGAMRGQPALLFATAMEWISSELERLGVAHEVLGFTTNEWKPVEQRTRIRELRDADDPERKARLLGAYSSVTATKDDEIGMLCSVIVGAVGNALAPRASYEAQAFRA